MPVRTADTVRNARSLCALFQETVVTHHDRVALRSADGATTLTWAQYGNRVRDVAAGLSALGVGRGDTVALMLTNRPEFNVVDAAAITLGRSRSRYTTPVRPSRSIICSPMPRTS